MSDALPPAENRTPTGPDPEPGPAGPGADPVGWTVPVPVVTDETPADPDPAGQSEGVEADGSVPSVRAASREAARSLGPADRVIPTWTDTTVRRAADLIGGPLGRHALIGRMPILTPLRVLLLMTIGVLILAWLAKSPCIQTGVGGFLDQSGNRPWITGCYNDSTTIYKGRGLDQGHWVYSVMFDTDGQQLRFIEYPALTSYWLWITGLLTTAYMNFAASSGVVPVPLDYAAFFTIGAIMLAAVYLWAVAATLKMARRRPWDVAIMCLSPLLIVHAFTNWDLLALAIMAGAMAAWARSRPLLAGVLIGLGLAAKLYPVLLIGPLLVLCLRTGKIRPLVTTTVAAAVTWVAVNLPAMLTNFDAWKEFITFNTQRTSEYSTLYQIFTRWSGSTLFEPPLAPGESPAVLNAVSLVAFGVCCLAIGWFGLSVKRRPRVAQLVFLVVAAFLLTNKVWSPQYSLWLLPLVVLALPKWRILIIWQLVEASVWYLLMPTFIEKDGVREVALPYYPFQGAVLIRDAIVIILAVLVIRAALRPETDVIRTSGDDDPTGGVLQDAPDRWTLPSLPDLWHRYRSTRAAVPVADETGEDEREWVSAPR